MALLHADSMLRCSMSACQLTWTLRGARISRQQPAPRTSGESLQLSPSPSQGKRSPPLSFPLMLDASPHLLAH